MEYRIASFNMYKFQAYRRDEQIRKDLGKIAEIILNERFDIIAMQEIFDSRPMHMLLAMLGKNWAGEWGQPNSRSVQAAEGFAFLWNTQKIELAESTTVSGKRTYLPRIYNQYRINPHKGQERLVRDPFYGRFKPKYENYEIRLINTHIMHTRGKEDETDSSTLSDIELRRKELDVLIKNIYAQEHLWRYGNNLPAYTILLGDYNLNLPRAWTKGAYLDEVIELKDGRSTYCIRTTQDQLTTLKNRSRQTPEEPARGFANNYDHFSYDEEKLNELHPKVYRVDSVRKYCNDNFEKHKKEVSDHVPICITLNARG